MEDNLASTIDETRRRLSVEDHNGQVVSKWMKLNIGKNTLDITES